MRKEPGHSCVTLCPAVRPQALDPPLMSLEHLPSVIPPRDRDRVPLAQGGRPRRHGGESTWPHRVAAAGPPPRQSLFREFELQKAEELGLVVGGDSRKA